MRKILLMVALALCCPVAAFGEDLGVSRQQIISLLSSFERDPGLEIRDLGSEGDVEDRTGIFLHDDLLYVVLEGRDENLSRIVMLMEKSEDHERVRTFYVFGHVLLGAVLPNTEGIEHMFNFSAFLLLSSLQDVEERPWADWLAEGIPYYLTHVSLDDGERVVLAIGQPPGLTALPW